MSTPIFAKTHNLIAFLEKPSESDGFEQIVDSLNVNQVKYALTVSLTIYTSCIKQFWTTLKIKTVNDNVRLQALIDGKKVVITEAFIRQDLKLSDAEGTSCLPNAVIFEELARMGYEKPSEKLTFYKAFFSPQWNFFIHTILQCLSVKTTSWNEFSSCYNVVAPPPIGLFSPLTIDLSNSGLEEFQHPKFKGYGPKDSKSVYVDTSNEIKNVLDALTIKDWVSDSDEDESKEMGNKVTSAVGNQGTNAVKSSACLVWRPKIKVQDHVSKNSGSYICKRFDYVDPEGRLNSLTLRSMMDGMLPLGEELKVERLLAKAQSELAEAMNTACYVQNMVLVVKPHFKTPYELFKGRSPALSFMRPFVCHVSILNTLDQLGKFNGKLDEGIFVGYSTTSKAFRVYNIRIRKVEENLRITFLENKPVIIGGGTEWLFDIDALLKAMNYRPVPARTNSNDFASKGASFDAGQSSMETRSSQNYILMQIWKDNSLFDSSS
nr:retrovirus-related Pol polyprotein from transposon TNT 1-94 [Tanacetum cinerariifolium]